MTPKVSVFDVDRLILLLKNCDWTDSHECCRLLGMEDTFANRRIIRAIAEASNGEIMSGNNGYKLTCHATPEERSHAINRLKSQARKMLERAEKYELAYA